MTKYTANDFANARFAEHPDGRNAHRINHPDGWSWAIEDLNGNRDRVNENYMMRLGWVPVPTKPTITESETATEERRYGTDYWLGFRRGFERAGGEVIPDPEPTNTERLTEMYKDWSCLANPESETFPEYLDRHGVTAPNVKGD